MASDRLMRWMLILKEYGSKIHYVPGLENIVVDSMNRIPIIDDDIEVKQLYARKISTIRGPFARTRDITKECLLVNFPAQSLDKKTRQINIKCYTFCWRNFYILHDKFLIYDVISI